MRDDENRSATLERPMDPDHAAHRPQHRQAHAQQARAQAVPLSPLQQETPEADATDDDSGRKAQGIRDLAGGAVLIGIGLAMGGSVFAGNPTVLDWFFDVLGTFWVVKGLYLLST